MRVIAFSCIHLCLPETQVELHDELLEYLPARELIKQLIENPPDYVINLGDFTEPFYDPEDVVSKMLPDYFKLKETVEVIELSGNHDNAYGGRDYIFINGIKCEHGHKFIGKRNDFAETREEYIKNLRKAVIDNNERIVYGHTHVPCQQTPYILDVGSVTLSQTYGEIIDGVPELKYI